MSSNDKKKSLPVKVIAQNRKARFRFFIIETLETGISLTGYEVKSLREGKISLDESLISEYKGEFYLINAHIAPYKHYTQADYDPLRKRKLLLHRKEIEKWSAQAQAKGMTIVPLELYFKDGRVKVLIALAKGKNTEDKRETIKKREQDREIQKYV